MKITDILRKECVRVPLKAADRTAAITELLDLLNTTGQLTDADDALKAVLTREQTRSTGIGRGLAVPHGKSHGCPRLAMAIGKPAAPIDFASVDGRPCDIVVLLTSPIDETGPHIHALAAVSRLWLNESFYGAVANAETPDELYAAIELHQG